MGKISKMAGNPIRNLIVFSLDRRKNIVDFRRKEAKAWLAFLGSRDKVITAARKAWNRYIESTSTRHIRMLDPIAAREAYGYSPTEWLREKKDLARINSALRREADK